MGDSRNEPPLKIPTVKEEIGNDAEKYKERTTIPPNQLAAEESKTLVERLHSRMTGLY